MNSRVCEFTSIQVCEYTLANSRVREYALAISRVHEFTSMHSRVGKFSNSPTCHFTIVKWRVCSYTSSPLFKFVCFEFLLKKDFYDKTCEKSFDKKFYKKWVLVIDKKIFFDENFSQKFLTKKERQRVNLMTVFLSKTRGKLHLQQIHTHRETVKICHIDMVRSQGMDEPKGEGIDNS